jgi:hypothetical protein
MKNIAVLLPGIIRSYDNLEYINKIRELEHNNDYRFYFFGISYDFKGSDTTAWHTQLDIDKNEKLDIDRVNSYNFTSFEVRTDIITTDTGGYDGRILGQWKLVYDCFNLAKQYSTKTDIKFDWMIRSRWDLKINCDKLKEVMEAGYTANVLSCIKYVTITDQSFMGPVDKMETICSLVNHYYEYLSLSKFIEKTKEHQKNVKYIKENKHKFPRRVLRDRKNEFNLRFPAQSEHLLTHHIFTNFKWGHDAVNMKNKNKWWQLRNVRI